MRVFNPGPGEAIDRLTVLELKLANSKDKSHWEQEKKELEQFVSSFLSNVETAEYETKREELTAYLRKVNKNIWEGIDQQREFRKKFGDFEFLSVDTLLDIARLGIYVMEQNDIRAKLIGELNTLYGISRIEKLV